MMKKILTFSVVLAMAFMAFAGVTAGYGGTLQGATEDGADGQIVQDGNVTVIHVQDPGDIPVSQGSWYTDGDGYTSWNWDASGQWASEPNTAGEDLYFIKESGGAIAATHADVTETTRIKDSQFDMVDTLETIPEPTANIVGTDYINMTIPAFKYTDYNGGASSQQGTFDVVTSYAVFYSDDAGTTWSYAGNAEHFVDGPDDPLVPMSGGDPSSTDTGHYTFNTSTDGGLTLDAGTDYEFKIRVNIGPTEAEGGYGGGLGSYTTYSAGSSVTIPTDGISEFGVGLIVPVIATIGLFATFTVYRKRKKDE